MIITSPIQASEESCDKFEIAKAVINKSYMQSGVVSSFVQHEETKKGKHMTVAKMEKSAEIVPKPRTALFQEGKNDEPMATQNVFDAQDTLENISKPRTALFKEWEDDEPMASQNMFVENSSPISNMIIGLQFGALIFGEKHSKDMDKFTAAGL